MEVAMDTHAEFILPRVPLVDEPAVAVCGHPWHRSAAVRDQANPELDRCPECSGDTTLDEP